MRSPGAGGYDFANTAESNSPKAPLWSPLVLPSVIVLTELPAELADPRFKLPQTAVDAAALSTGGDRIIEHHGATLRLHALAGGADPPAILLPLDQLFEIRVAAAARLWRCMTGRTPGPNPAKLSTERRDRLILGLRALDGKLENASYREIAEGLFGSGCVPGRDWKSHDLRDRTIRLVRYGVNMMQGGYRSLLLHPYRRRP